MGMGCMALNAKQRRGRRRFLEKFRLLTEKKKRCQPRKRNNVRLLLLHRGPSNRFRGRCHAKKPPGIRNLQRHPSRGVHHRRHPANILVTRYACVDRRTSGTPSPSARWFYPGASHILLVAAQVPIPLSPNSAPSTTSHSPKAHKSVDGIRFVLLLFLLCGSLQFFHNKCPIFDKRTAETYLYT